MHADKGVSYYGQGSPLTPIPCWSRDAGFVTVACRQNFFPIRSCEASTVVANWSVSQGPLLADCHSRLRPSGRISCASAAPQYWQNSRSLPFKIQNEALSFSAFHWCGPKTCLRWAGWMSVVAESKQDRVRWANALSRRISEVDVRLMIHNAYVVASTYCLPVDAFPGWRGCGGGFCKYFNKKDLGA
jgi:hypothetical protein